MLENADRFPFVRHLEANFEPIREEMERLSAERYRGGPLENAYVGAWRLFCLYSRDPEWLFAGDCSENARLCPRSHGVMTRIPGLLLGGFSMLAPGTHIFRHTDEIAVDCVRCHLALRTDGRAGMRFDADPILYENGRCLVFEGHHGHEAWNPGEHDRVVLLVDVARDRVMSPILEPGRTASGSA